MVYNTPRASQVVAIWIDEDSSADIILHDISISFILVFHIEYITILIVMINFNNHVS